MVPGAGLEPARCYQRGILNPLCLPISPPGHWVAFQRGVRRRTWCGVADYGGGTRSRTEIHGFAIRCIAILPFRLWLRCDERPSTANATFEKLERETRFELATPTLARLCSTNWAIPALFSCWLLTEWFTYLLVQTLLSCCVRSSQYVLLRMWEAFYLPKRMCQQLKNSFAAIFAKNESFDHKSVI